MSETGENARRLIAAITRVLAAVPDESARAVVQRLAAQRLDATVARSPKPTWLPVLRHLAHTVGEAMLLSPQLAAGLAVIEDDLHWRQSEAYSDDVLGEGFMANYGWCQLIGPHGFFPGDDLLLGLLLLGPRRHYRDHAHPAPELYLPLNGGAEWKRGHGAFVAKPAGSVIWHEPNEVHATRTSDMPLLAVWCWTCDVATPARLVVQA